MEIAASQLPRAVRLALIGVGTAFAWIVLSLVLGLGTPQAHAAESDDDGLLGGLLGGVTSVVDETASTVTTTVTSTVSAVTNTATSTVNAVVAVVPAPVQQPVSQVVQTVGNVVGAVTQPVTDVVSGGVVSGITQPVVDLVTDVPIVGGIVSGIGLDDTVSDIGNTVDDTLGGVVGGVVDSVDDTVTGIAQPPAGGDGPLIPGLPGLPGIDLPGGSDAISGAGVDGIAALQPTDASATRFSTTAGLRGAWGAASVPVSAVSNAVVVPSAPLGSDVPSGASGGGLCLPAASAGPGGAGPGTWAYDALNPLDADRAWVLRAGPEDEHAPPAPAGSTDVSPD